MSRPWLLAIDLGSGGPKVAAVSPQGRVLGSAFQTVRTIAGPGGSSTQDVGAWWDGITDGVARLLTAAVRADDLVAIGITGQWGSTVPVDEHGRAVGPCLMWSDQRGAPLVHEAIGGLVAGYRPGVIATAVQINGGAPPVASGEGLGHALFLPQADAERYARTAALLEPVDYLGARLTGKVAATPASMFPSWLIDTRRDRPRHYSPTLVRRYQRDPDRLPPLQPSLSVLGELTDQAGAELGLPPGTPVAAGTPDLYAAYVGSGAIEPYQAHLAVSTTSWLSCRVPDRRLDPIHLIGTVSGLEDDWWLVVDDQAAAGACLTWWRRALALVPGDGPGAGGSAALLGDGDGGYAALVALAGQAPVGSGGARFLPWLRGEHTPLDDPAARAGFLDVGMGADLTHLTRAILEGVALNGRWMLEAVQRLHRQRFETVRILGGGAQSDLWCQIYADVLDRPIERVADPMHAQLRGAALMALVSLSQLTLTEAAELVPLERTFLPEPAGVAVLAERYEELRASYRALVKAR